MRVHSGAGLEKARDLGWIDFGEPRSLPSTRAEWGKLEIIPARRAHAAFSAASESIGMKGPFQPWAISTLLIRILNLRSPGTRRG